MYDNKVLFLSDIQATGWHATELRNVHDGDSVAIWGCGPGLYLLPCPIHFCCSFIPDAVLLLFSAMSAKEKLYRACSCELS